MNRSLKQSVVIAVCALMIGGSGLGLGIYSILNPRTVTIYEEDDTPSDDDTSPDDDGTTPDDDGTTPDDDGTIPPLPYDFIIPTFNETDIFVAEYGGIDSPDKGNQTDPYRTISYAMSQASIKGAERIIVGCGYYNESITVIDGVSIHGGYSEDFELHSIKYFKPIIEYTGTLELWTLYCKNINSPTLIEGFIIKGPKVILDGMNSYAIFLEQCSSNLTIRYCEIWGGVAGDGQRGSTGTDGYVGVNGGNGEDAQDYTLASGGQGGQLVSGDGTALNGGDGGDIGDPPVWDTQTAYNGTVGYLPWGGEGGAAGYDSGMYDPGGGIVVIPPSNNINGLNGEHGGDGNHGLGGAGGQQSSYTISLGEWRGDDGNSGVSGTHGGGGGGGGAGGGIEDLFGDYGNHIIGGTGGGGGSGGARGEGGNGGQAGGGAFCIYVLFYAIPNSIPSILNNSLYLGKGGDGGMGGKGGIGSSGGKGGLGGNIGSTFPYNCAGKGGEGGDGGDGGCGGGGGGGTGGWSIGVFVRGQAGLVPTYHLLNEIYTFIGSAGTGGQGGFSLGNNGDNGEDGLLAATFY